MATTRLNQIIGRWNEIERQQKEAYKARKGLKIARGWKESPEFKDIEKRKKRAVYRYGYRKRQNYFKKKANPGGNVVKENPLPSEITYANGDPHHLVLSYGSKMTRDLVEDIEDQRKGGRTALVGGYVNGELIGTAGTEIGVSRLFKELYEKADEIQARTKDTVIPVFSTGQFFQQENTWRTVVEVRE
jgi:hypothetical protein